jgi:hypothetical protein
MPEWATWVVVAVFSWVIVSPFVGLLFGQLLRLPEPPPLPFSSNEVREDLRDKPHAHQPEALQPPTERIAT